MEKRDLSPLLEEEVTPCFLDLVVCGFCARCDTSRLPAAESVAIASLI